MRMKSNELTILLTLKGRHLYTLRWLWHANRTLLPFHVLVADGEVHPTIARLLSDPTTFPNLSFEYHQYDDRSFRDFYFKCDDCLKKVATPYVKYSDNDDFLFPSGIERSVGFLNSSASYICAGGGIAGFSVGARADIAHALVGRLDYIRYRYSSAYRCRDIDNPSTVARVLEEIRNYHSVYYHVYRTHTLRTIAGDLLSHNFTILQLHEMYGALRALTLGFVRSDPTALTEFRQYRTSIKHRYHADWVSHLVYNQRTAQEFEILGSAIGGAAGESDNVDYEFVVREILDAYVDRLRWQLGRRLRHYGANSMLARLRRLIRPLVSTKLLPAKLREFVYRNYLFRKLESDGASRETIDMHRKELCEIEATLSGEEFLAFVHDHAPDLLNIS
jgi:glycosyltransferase domain-containing protein